MCCLQLIMLFIFCHFFFYLILAFRCYKDGRSKFHHPAFRKLIMCHVLHAKFLVITVTQVCTFM